MGTDLIAELESAMREISQLDSAHGADLEALGVLLLRTESVASSKIEAVEASLDGYARALHGIRSNSSAVSMVAATTALARMISEVAGQDRIELAAITSAHEALMRDDPGEALYAGRLRDMQNWIGGSDYSPRGALYVPPPPDTVGSYLDDLLAFANRDDLPALVQAASESRTTARRLREIPDEWRELVGAVRGGSAAAMLLAVLPSRPILSAEDAYEIVDAPRSSVFAAINRLHEAGVLRPLTQRKRDQVWGAESILDELDDLGVRIASASV